MRSKLQKTLAIVAFTWLPGLGCDSSTEPEDSGPKAISIALSHQNLTKFRGGEDSVAVTVTRTNFDGAVRLAVEGVPAGVSASFDPSLVPAGASRSMLRFSVADGAAFAASTITVNASAEGVGTHVASFSLNIVVQGDYSLSVLDRTVTVAQGGAGSATVFVSQDFGFNGNVALALGAVPAGVTITLDPPATAGGPAELRVSATSSATPGSYSATVTGVTEGLADRATTVSVVVIPPPSTASLTFEFCESQVPVWVAFQNEGYAWQRVSGTGRTFTFQATEKVGLAWAFLYGSTGAEVMIRYATRSEYSAVNLASGCSGTKSVSGSVASLASNQVVMAAMGVSRSWIHPYSPSFTLQNVAAGPLDLIAARGLPAGVDGTEPAWFTPDRLIIRRSLDLANGGAMPALDFGSSEAFAPSATGLTITGFNPAEQVEVSNWLRSATSTFARIHSRQVVTVPTTLYSVPAEKLAAGDLHQLAVAAYGSGSIRVYLAYFSAPADQTAALGPLAGLPSLTMLTSSPYARLRARLPVQPEYSGAATFIFGGLRGASRNVHVGITAAYLGGTPSEWDVLVPNLSGTAGFQSSWMPTEGQAGAYQADVYSTGHSGVIPQFRPPNAGDVIRSSTRFGPR